jgi:uncharacterized OB-fold protein
LVDYNQLLNSRMIMLRKPELYEAVTREEAGALAMMKGGSCRRCGHIFFPYQTLGCEICGAHDGDLVPRALSGAGTLVASVTVHNHGTGDRLSVVSPMPTPFVVATVRLAEGPTTRGLVVSGNERLLHPGDAMRAVLAEAPSIDGEPPVLDLRFAPVASTPTVERTA